MYDPQMVKPMREELTQVGVKELLTASEVDSVFSEKKGTHLLMVNSVCGCAAGSARPGLIKALKNSVHPSLVTTVFAGVDQEAVKRAREYIVGYPPSSPAMALFRDGQLVHMLERHDIEGVDGNALSKVIASMFDKYCGDTVNESIKIADPLGDMEIEPKALDEALKSKKITRLLDCRDDFERQQANLEGSVMLTQEVADEIIKAGNKNEEIAIYCHSGQRSFQAVRYFRQFGFDQVKSLRGGITAWSREVDPSIPTY